ncbi:hypothetical protein DFH09DRAFT_1150597 [Mycena vulgaris]|nr:hypothetical protein DFH09DRAFT_1150597 [Mycena vulgaris]
MWILTWAVARMAITTNAAAKLRRPAPVRWYSRYAAMESSTSRIPAQKEASIAKKPPQHATHRTTGSLHMSHTSATEQTPSSRGISWGRWCSPISWGRRPGLVPHHPARYLTDEAP